MEDFQRATGALCARPKGSAEPKSSPVRTFGRLTTSAPAVFALFDTLERVARTNVTVTLMGETGSGKDHIAHTLHEQGSRASGPMVVFDCGSVAANLAESELLGHERGAFTGAVSAHAGAFERAHRGTLFLDEIAELPLDLQPRLLRALESRSIRRVGGRTDRRVDVRVIAATHRDLRTLVGAGFFREDLFFRLAVAVVGVPPLRQRLEDLPELVHTLLHDIGRADLRASEASIAALRGRAWPGNVRELKNALICAAAFVDPEVKLLEPQHLRLAPQAEVVGRDGGWIDDLPLAGHSLDRIERVAILQTLRQLEGNKMAAARSLGIAVSTLYEKLRKLGLEGADVRFGEV
jgi:DNA-binding NtrC family response regulator